VAHASSGIPTRRCIGASNSGVACLRAQSSKLYHLGIRGSIARNRLANTNATRDWRIYASFAQHLIRLARGLYADEPADGASWNRHLAGDW
jgi:hypothetical protein